jgi:hypothetical protein
VTPQWRFCQRTRLKNRLTARLAQLPPQRHVSQMYGLLKQRRNYYIVVVAVARHLAEAAWHVLTRREAYRDFYNGTLSEITLLLDFWCVKCKKRPCQAGGASL